MPTTADDHPLIGTIKDVYPLDIEIEITRHNGVKGQISVGDSVEMDDTVSIKDWCRTSRTTNSQVIVATKDGEVSVHCAKDTVTFRTRGIVIPPISPGNAPLTTPTITSQLNWYDVKWSKTTVNANEEYEITGKLHVNTWPAVVPVLDNALLNVVQPGPVADTVAVYIGGQFTPLPVKLALGKTYDIRLVQRAHRPGRWQPPVQLSVKTGGPISGPGQYIDAKGNFADYTDEIKLLNGTTVDLEDYGIGKIYLWYVLWVVAAVALFYWLIKRGLVGRFVAVASGKADERVTRKEWLLGTVTLGAVLGTVIITYAVMSSNHSDTIPLKGGDIKNIEPIAEEPAPIKIKYLGGTYNVPGRELVANLKVTNEAKEPLRIGELATAGHRFLNPDVYTTKEDLLADRGLSLSDSTAIQPGETRDITITVQDARGDIERHGSSFAGLLLFNTPSGTRYPVEVGGPV